MGIMPLLFVGLIVFIILYAWALGEAEDHPIPVFILLILTIAFFISMGILGQWYLNIGAFSGAFLGACFAAWYRTYHTDNARVAYRTDICWHCHKRFDRRKAEVCTKCQKHYHCPYCGKCLCDKPDYDPEKDDSRVIKIRVKIKPVEVETKVEKPAKEKRKRKKKEAKIQEQAVETKEA